MSGKHFGERLKRVRKALGLTQGQLADRLGISQGSLSSAEIGRNFLGTPQLNRLIETFNISIDYLLTGKGPMFIEGKAKSVVDVPIGNAGHAIPVTIPYGKESVLSLSLPELGTLHLVKVQGESMEPFLMPGDYVGCAPVRAIRDIDPTRVYVVNTRDEGVYVKFILVTEDRLILRSANPAYPDQSIPISEVRTLHEVKVRITRHVLPVHEIASMAFRLQKIEESLRQHAPAKGKEL